MSRPPEGGPVSKVKLERRAVLRGAIKGLHPHAWLSHEGGPKDPNESYDEDIAGAAVKAGYREGDTIKYTITFTRKK